MNRESTHIMLRDYYSATSIKTSKVGKHTYVCTLQDVLSGPGVYYTQVSNIANGEIATTIRKGSYSQQERMCLIQATNTTTLPFKCDKLPEDTSFVDCNYRRDFYKR